jgi:hypothetical protein
MPPKNSTKPEAPDKARGMTMRRVEDVYDITRRKQMILIQQGILQTYKLGRTRYIIVDSIESAIASGQR